MYGTIRGMAVWGILFVLPHLVGEDTHSWLLDQAEPARLIAASQLILLGIAGSIIVGL
jgi:hypothetical protein